MGIKAKVITYETLQNNKIVYVIETTNQTTSNNRIIKMRYSEIKKIHEELIQFIHKLNLKILLPQFPSRKFFSTTNKSQDSIQQRKKDLSLYLANLLSNPKLHMIDIIKKYYLPEDIKHKQNIQKQINIQIFIDRYTLVEDIVIYYIRMRDVNTHEQWTFRSRYSELRNMHRSLQENIKNLPIFPKKKLFGITNQNPEDIELRRNQLAKYFEQIVMMKQIVNSEAMKYFIKYSKQQAKKDQQVQALRRSKLSS